MSPVLRLQTEPVEIVRVENVDQGTERESIIPVGGKICHRNLKISRQPEENILPSYRIIFDPVLDPHQDHLLSSRPRSGRHDAPGPGVVLLLHHLVGDGGPGSAGGHAGVPVEVGWSDTAQWRSSCSGNSTEQISIK